MDRILFQNKSKKHNNNKNNGSKTTRTKEEKFFFCYNIQYSWISEYFIASNYMKMDNTSWITVINFLDIRSLPNKGPYIRISKSKGNFP